MVDLATFVAARRGRQVCNFGYCQCVALANDWMQGNGWRLPSGSTAGSLSFPAPWVRLPITLAQPGDLVQWHTDLPGSGGDGHIGIYLGRLSSGFRSFDQNWSCGCSTGPCPCCCEIDHQDFVTDLPFVAGAWRWMPPVIGPQPAPPAPPQPSVVAWPESGLDLTGSEL